MNNQQLLSRFFFFLIVVINLGLPAPENARAAQAPTPVFKQCSLDQQAILELARRDAENLALNSFRVLKETPVDERATSSRYKEWFGAYDAANYALVLDHFQHISEAFATQKITFICGCKDLIYAHVSPDHPYEITLCASFWNAPSMGTNSQAGTLLHEMSHFTSVASTVDHVYTQTYSRLLAQFVPLKAIINADSYRYYSENDPKLEPGG